MDIEKRAASPLESREVQGAVELPPVDIFEVDDGLVLIADVPGAGDADVEVNVDDDVMTIVARVAGEAPTGRTVRAEFEPCSFRRSFSLSRDIKREGIQGSVKDGVLRIELPKVKEAKVHRIQIRQE